MPFFPFAMPEPTLIQAVLARVAPEPPAVEQVLKGSLTLEYADESSVEPETGIVIGKGNVRLLYGEVIMTCDEVHLDYKSKTGFARGNVVLTAAEGKLACNDLVFDWGLGTGSAREVSINALGMKGTAATLKITRDRWELLDVYGTPSNRKTPDLAVKMPKLVLVPGRTGTASSPRIILFGKTLPPLPTSKFSLDKRVEGIRVPGVSFRRKAGLGISWSSGILLNDLTALSATYNAFPQSLPTMSLSLTRSNVPPTKSTGFILPRTELGERAADGYLNNIVVDNPTDEDSNIRRPKSTYSLMSAWNLGTTARLVEADGISKLWEASAERGGGSEKGLGYFSQARVHQIRQSDRDAWKTRGLLNGTLAGPRLRFTKEISLQTRVDGLGAVGGGDKGFGWLRAEAGLVFQPKPQFRLGAAYVRGKEFGDPLFVMDRLYSRHAAHVRADILLKNMRLSALWKYDFNRQHWYDTEWAFSLAAGSFEPYISTRLFPRETRIGIRFRINSFTDVITDRTLKREKPSGSK